MMCLREVGFFAEKYYSNKTRMKKTKNTTSESKRIPTQKKMQSVAETVQPPKSLAKVEECVSKLKKEMDSMMSWAKDAEEELNKKGAGIFRDKLGEFENSIFYVGIWLTDLKRRYEGMKQSIAALEADKEEAQTEMTLGEFKAKFAKEIAETSDWNLGEMKKHGHTRKMSDEYALKHVIDIHDEITVTDN